MQDIQQFIKSFYDIYVKQDSGKLKTFYLITFDEPISIDDIECEEDDRMSCMFWELFDILVERMRSECSNVWSILYCSLINSWFLVSKDWDEYHINWEDIGSDIKEQTIYFYDLFSND